MRIQHSIKKSLPFTAFLLLVGLTLFIVFAFRSYAQENSVSVAGACDVANVNVAKTEKMIVQGSFPRWSETANLITFTQEINNQFEVFTMSPDGSGVTCLTCGKSALATTRHRGQSAWHPNGTYIVFTAESAAYQRVGDGTTARPGIGRNHNVWLMTSDGQKFWQLTDYPENWGVIEPFFSHDGSMLHWCEEYQMEEYPQGKPGVDTHPGCWWGTENLTYRKGEELCSWRVKYAPISFDGNGDPVISGNTLPLAIEASQTLPNVTAINPPDNFTLIESNGFTPDDRGFIGAYCDRRLTGGRCLSCDIYTWDLSGNNLKRLTWKATNAHEDPYYSPDGKKIAFKCIPGGYAQGEPDEYWLMDAEGTSQENECGDVQVTHFNAPGYAEYDAISKQNTEETWCPDGTCLVIGHVSSLQERGPHIPSILYKLSFTGSCGTGN
jgi:hypothetical protein